MERIIVEPHKKTKKILILEMEARESFYNGHSCVLEMTIIDTRERIGYTIYQRAGNICETCQQASHYQNTLITTGKFDDKILNNIPNRIESHQVFDNLHSYNHLYSWVKVIINKKQEREFWTMLSRNHDLEIYCRGNYIEKAYLKEIHKSSVFYYELYNISRLLLYSEIKEEIAQRHPSLWSQICHCQGHASSEHCSALTAISIYKILTRRDIQEEDLKMHNLVEKTTHQTWME